MPKSISAPAIKHGCHCDDICRDQPWSSDGAIIHQPLRKAHFALQHLELHLWQKRLKALTEVNLLLTGAKAALIEHHTQRRLRQGCYRFDEAHVDVIGKAS